MKSFGFPNAGNKNYRGRIILFLKFPHASFQGMHGGISTGTEKWDYNSVIFSGTEFNPVCYFFTVLCVMTPFGVCMVTKYSPLGQEATETVSLLPGFVCR